uniref:Uncharacterized protein n=1 Tax=Nelumbo nucifera TaxID=4432 RepID=A0A822XPC6_NELNU|nr:TPA_asm: hypothetical protein HUJ06_020811 [Nelumbo nucifera]
MQLPNQSHIPTVISAPTSCYVKQGYKNGGCVSMGNFNQENVMPCTGDTNLPSVSCSYQLVYPMAHSTNLCSDRIIENPILCFRPVTTSGDLSGNILHAKLEVPFQAVCNHLHGISGSTNHSVNSKAGYYVLDKKHISWPQPHIRMLRCQNIPLM